MTTYELSLAPTRPRFGVAGGAGPRRSLSLRKTSADFDEVLRADSDDRLNQHHHSRARGGVGRENGTMPRGRSPSPSSQHARRGGGSLGGQGPSAPQHLQQPARQTWHALPTCVVEETDGDDDGDRDSVVDDMMRQRQGSWGGGGRRSSSRPSSGRSSPASSAGDRSRPSTPGFIIAHRESMLARPLSPGGLRSCEGCSRPVTRGTLYCGGALGCRMRDPHRPSQPAAPADSRHSGGSSGGVAVPHLLFRDGHDLGAESSTDYPQGTEEEDDIVPLHGFRATRQSRQSMVSNISLDPDEYDAGEQEQLSSYFNSVNFPHRLPPFNEVIKCLIHRKSTARSSTFELHFETPLSPCPASFLLAARKRKKTKTAYYAITDDRDDPTCKQAAVGKLQASNLLGTNFTISIPMAESAKPASRRASVKAGAWSKVGNIAFPVNPMGLKGERTISGALLATSRRRMETVEIPFENQRPVFEPSIGKFVMDFGGRNLQPSTRNFQLLVDGELLVRFGKRDKDLFVLDFRPPATATIAFAIGLAALDRRFLFT